MSEQLGIASPWLTFAREIHKLFEYDPEVEVIYDNDKPEVALFVANETKADALAQLLPTEKAFGNVTLAISVIPANEDMSKAELFRRAFANNPAVESVETVVDVFGNDISYVVFKPEVVQFPNDNIGDLNGCSHTLFETIAKETFEGDAGLRFCTGLALGTPLGEWP